MTGSQQLRDFQPTTAEGDPGKLAYLHNADWTPKPFEELGAVKAMPGTCLKCVFGIGEHAAGCIKLVSPATFIKMVQLVIG
jgi:hypothetical protein